MPKSTGTAPASTPAIDRTVVSSLGSGSALSAATFGVSPSGSIGWMTGEWTPMASESE